MRRLMSYVVAGILLIPLSVVALLLGAFVWLRFDLPEPSGNVASAELSAPVEVIFDRNAVPHIFAETLDDAYFALGYLHARDRLWQMETQRRIAQGRMSEILGRLTLQLDRMLRTFDLYRSARASFETQPRAVRRALQMYAAGVNDYLSRRAEPLPLEFQLVFHRPEPWHPADTLVWFKTMALLLGRDYRSELLRARLLAVVGAEKLRELFTDYRPGDPVTVPREGRPAASAVQSPTVLSVTSTAESPAKLRDVATLEPLLSGGGVLGHAVRASNTWVVSGAHTASGKPILANDPHLALDAPALWYLVRIVTPDHEIAGATVPGVPFHLLGQSRDLAWGVTATGIDAQDLVIEATEAAPGAGAAVLSSREVQIGVRFDDPVSHTVRRSLRGPLLSDVDGTAAAIAGPGRSLALLASVFSGNDTTATALHGLNRAASIAQAHTALAHLVGTTLNVTLADSGGAIGYLAAGQIPIRQSGDGWLPQQPGAGVAVWRGFVPLAQQPQLHDPESGRIVNANNAIAAEDYPYFLAHEWEAPYRARRISALLDRHMLEKPGQYTVEDAVAMQGDNLSLAALDLLAVLTRVRTEAPELQAALALLSSWDGEMLRERPEPLLFWLWVRTLNRLVFADELGSLYPSYAGYRPRVLADALGGKGDWCDSAITPKRRENCQGLILEALESALARGRELYGENVERWRWGTAHRALLQHRLLSRIPLLSALLDISIETDGGNYTLNRGASYGGAVEQVTDGNPFAHVHGAGYRAVYDLADPGNSRYVIATGQSGNPLSPHYDDFVERWRDGEYVRLSGTRMELRTDALGVLSFSPGD